jgi:hypothetical protein
MVFGTLLPAISDAILSTSASLEKPFLGNQHKSLSTTLPGRLLQLQRLLSKRNIQFENEPLIIPFCLPALNINWLQSWARSFGLLSRRLTSADHGFDILFQSFFSSRFLF